jgi:hypothetical protein
MLADRIGLTFSYGLPILCYGYISFFAASLQARTDELGAVPAARFS